MRQLWPAHAVNALPTRIIVKVIRDFVQGKAQVAVPARALVAELDKGVDVGAAAAAADNAAGRDDGHVGLGGERSTEGGDGEAEGDLGLGGEGGGGGEGVEGGGHPDGRAVGVGGGDCLVLREKRVSKERKGREEEE